MTAPTPMMIPSMVRIVRSLLRASALSATRIISLGFMLQPRFRMSSRSPRRSAAKPGRTLTAPAGCLVGLLGGHQKIAFLQVSLDELRVVVIRDPDLYREGDEVFVRTQLPNNLPAAQMRGRSLA